jgi:cytochrome c
MDFLKHLATPQSVGHFHLLLVIAGLLSTILYPYLGFLLGSSFLSVLFNKKGMREGEPRFVRFAKDLVDTALFNKSIPTFLALLPCFSLVFVYAQLMQSTDAISVGLVGYGFILLLIAIILLYTYKYTFRLSGVLEGYESLLKSRSQPATELGKIEEFSKQTVESYHKAGRWGILLLAVAAFLLVSSVSVNVNPSDWTQVTSVFDLFVSFDVLIRILEFLALAAGATGIGVLFFFFSWQGGKRDLDPEYASLVRRVAVRLAVTSLLVQPILILISLLLLPSASLSGTLYGFTGVSLVLLFLAAHFIFAFVRDSHDRYASPAFYTFLFAFVFLFVNDQLAVHDATNLHAASLAYQYDQDTEALKAKLGVVVVTFTGEDIYNARCSACHLFDQKKVGPAYKDVIPQFEGKKQQLIAFILNPVKVNPAFPPMPNPGLKPAEADSIASFLLKKFATNAPAHADSTKSPSKQ